MPTPPVLFEYAIPAPAMSAIEIRASQGHVTLNVPSLIIVLVAPLVVPINRVYQRKNYDDYRKNEGDRIEKIH